MEVLLENTKQDLKWAKQEYRIKESSVVKSGNNRIKESRSVVKSGNNRIKESRSVVKNTNLTADVDLRQSKWKMKHPAMVKEIKTLEVRPPQCQRWGNGNI